MWKFIQSSGNVYKDDALIEVCYSGFKEGRNNPDLEDVPFVGPIPCGWYTVQIIRGNDGQPCDNGSKKAPVARLLPDLDTEVFGRADFEWHGDNITHTASHGCIISSHPTREQLQDGDRLQVTRT